MEHFNWNEVDFPDGIPNNSVDIQLFAHETPPCPKPCAASIERQNLRPKFRLPASLDVFSCGKHEYGRGERKFRAQPRQISIFIHLGFANPTSNPQPRHYPCPCTTPHTNTRCHQLPRVLRTRGRPMYTELTSLHRSQTVILETLLQTLLLPPFSQ